jgi:hypothetical protein
MKSYTLLVIVFSSTLTFSLSAQDNQDYIVNWENDTIFCKLPGDAKKAGLKPVWKYEDGYERIVAVSDNDSIRIINAGDIKGYSRQKHGKRLLCDGFFESKQILYTRQNQRTTVEGENIGNNSKWYFLNRIVQGKYATLYIWYETSNTVIPFFNKKKMVELLSDSDIASEMKGFKYRKSNKGFSEIVVEYNRLKEEAEVLKSE